MKVIFLDVDNCLNDKNTTDTIFGGYNGLDEDKIERLNCIVKETGAKIVLSTTWRNYPDFTEYLMYRMRSVDPNLASAVIGKTPNLCASRADEIEEWMKDNPSVDKFVVLDDLLSESLERFGYSFINTSEEDGLTHDIMKRCIEHLKS